MELQQMYDKMRTYFSKPGAELAQKITTGVAKSCFYRSPSGRKCAVGCLIPDRLYQEWFEDMGIGAVLVNLEAMTDDPGAQELYQLLDHDDRKRAFLIRAQFLHDTAEDVEQFLKNLDAHARYLELTVSAQA